MAKTAVVNKPKRRKSRAYGAARKTRRRRNPSTSIARASNKPRRRSRRRNPSRTELLDFKRVFRITFPATLGVALGRWAVKRGGDFDSDGPTLMNAAAGLIGVSIGSNIVGNVISEPRADEYAYVAGLGYLGELFLRKRFLRDQSWYTQNVSLEGGAMTYDQYMGGANLGGGSRQPGEVLEMPDGHVVQVLAGMGTDTFTTAQGRRFQRTPAGWQQMAGSAAAYLEEPAASLPGGNVGDFFSGFQPQSALGGAAAYASQNNSFGYGR